MEKEKLTFWEIVFEGLKKFAGEIIGALLLAMFLYYFPGLRSLITDYVFPKNNESQTNIQQELELHRKEEERLKEELRRKEEAIMNGANVNASGNDGRTVLWWATWKGRTETAQLLRKYGAK